MPGPTPDHQPDPDEVLSAGHLMEHHQPDDRGAGPEADEHREPQPINSRHPARGRHALAQVYLAR